MTYLEDLLSHVKALQPERDQDHYNELAITALLERAIAEDKASSEDETQINEAENRRSRRILELESELRASKLRMKRLQAELERVNKQRNVEQDKILELEASTAALGHRKLNINTSVRVKLTDLGVRIWGNYVFLLQNNLIPKSLTTSKTYSHKKGRELEVQLWELMLVFGTYTYNGCELPFETEIEVLS